MWVLLQIVWPRYGITSLEIGVAGDYIICGDHVTQVHAALLHAEYALTAGWVPAGEADATTTTVTSSAAV